MQITVEQCVGEHDIYLIRNIGAEVRSHVERWNIFPISYVQRFVTLLMQTIFEIFVFNNSETNRNLVFSFCMRLCGGNISKLVLLLLQFVFPWHIVKLFTCVQFHQNRIQFELLKLLSHTFDCSNLILINEKVDL